MASTITDRQSGTSSATSPTDRRQGVSVNLAIKAPCKAATTANITLEGEQTIDGVSCTAGDRVLVKDQTTASENGIYDVAVSSWVRSPDFDGSLDAATGTLVKIISGGTTNGGYWYELTTTGAITIGTTNLAFSRSTLIPGIASAADATAITIDSSERVGIGASPSYPFQVSVANDGNIAGLIQNTSASSPSALWMNLSAASPNNTTQYFLFMSDSTALRCVIYSNGDLYNYTGTYATISDGRLKRDIVDASSQWDDIKAIGKMGKKYRHIKDVANEGDEAKVMLGWVAQEVEQVSPGLVMHTFEDVKDEEGNVIGQEETLGIKSSILFTKGIIALAEAMERIEALELEIATLRQSAGR